jgi:dTDP-glucose 4,6-dehydratase
MDPEKFIPRMITDLIEGSQVKIYGDGKYVRDWLYVEDHVRAIDLVLHDGKVGETYVVGGLTEDINNLDVAKEVLKAFGKGEESIKFVEDRPGHDRRYAIDWSKINSDLGWKPEHNFKEWLTETIEWYKRNESWWKPLKAESEKLYAKTGQH